MISVKNLEYSYSNKTQFQFPDFVCNASETVLITGNSGVGKTTLLHLLGGLLKPNSGTISINNQSIQELSNKKLDAFRGQHIGIILQQNHFIESLSVLENVILASWLGSKKQNKDHAIKLLNQLELGGHINKLPSHLSTGQQQRVSIARALINNPKVILADEPTSSLDDTTTEIVASLLKKIAQEFTTALIIVTHDSRLKNKFHNQIELS